MTILLILILVCLAIGEIFSFRALQFLTKNKSKTSKVITQLVYWLWTLTIGALIIYAIVSSEQFSNPAKMNVAFVIIGLFLANFAFKTIFGGIHFMNELAAWFANLFSRKQREVSNGKPMSRSKFISLSGLALAAIPFSGLLYGMFRGRYQFRVIQQSLAIPNLPNSFVGKTIVQLSDMHLGSFPQTTKEIAKAVEQINALQADYIFFTGDMINERAIEAEPWVETIANLQAKEGKFSVLGNHDYGDYYGPWEGKPEKIEANVQHLQSLQEKMGFQLLRNENIKLSIGDSFIRLLGIENWGKGRFSKYGNLEQTLSGVKDEEVQILLSHDPSHWDAQVLGKTAVDVALAGHTHGSQIGVELPGFRWSPVQYRYNRWAGLYQEEKQQLYVNRGFGYIGYAGRIGIWPEITLFTLAQAE